MLNSAWTAAEMEKKIWTHQAPTQSRSPAHGHLRVSDIQYTLLDEINDLAVKRRLEAVRPVADNLFSNMDWLLADRSVERKRPLDRLRRCFVSRYYFD